MTDDETIIEKILSNTKPVTFRKFGNTSEHRDEILDKVEELIREAIKLARADEREKIKKIIIDYFNEGCGNEYLNEDEWELMCGKHIYKTKGKVKELRLCEYCVEHRDWLLKALEAQGE